jgi:hypothetical protein
MCGCTCGCDSGAFPEGRGRERFIRPWLEPTKAERKEGLEAFKKRLEGKLADVDEELRRL